MKTTTAPKVHAQGPKATGGGGSKAIAHGPKVKTTTAHGGGNKARATTATGVTTTATSKKSKGTTVATTGTTTGTTTAPLTKVQQKLQSNTNLASKLQGRLPAGTNLMQAAEGFRNLGQFVAAVNVSNNLDLPFRQLKARMVDDGMSLGQAIQDLRPRADATTEVRRAETDANRIITTTEAETAKKTKKSRG